MKKGTQTPNTYSLKFKVKEDYYIDKICSIQIPLAKQDPKDPKSKLTNGTALVSQF